MINSFYTYDKIILVSHHVSLNGVKKTEHFVNHWYISHVCHLDILGLMIIKYAPCEFHGLNLVELKQEYHCSPLNFSGDL